MTVLPVLEERFLIGLNTLQWYMVVRVGGVKVPLMNRFTTVGE